MSAIADNLENTGTIEIGYLPYTPAFGMILIDPETEDGVGIFEIYHHKSTERNATFTVSAVEDEQWYPFFQQQYELLWGCCRVKQKTLKFVIVVCPLQSLHTPTVAVHAAIH